MPDEYMTSTPPSRIEHGGKDYMIHMSFRIKREADEEARDLRDSGYKAKVFPWKRWWAVYEEVTG